MKDMIRKTQHNLTIKLYNPYKVSQWRKMLTLLKQLGILKDLRYHTLISYFIKAIKSIEPRKHAEVCNLYKQVISLLKTLGRKRIYTHYQDNVNIRSQNNTHQDVRIENRQVVEYGNNQLYQAIEVQKRKIDELKKELEILNEMNQTTEESRKRLKEVLDRKNYENEGLHQTIQEKDKEIDKLEEALNTAITENNKNNELQQIIEELQKKNDDLYETVKKYTGEIHNAHKKLTIINNNIEKVALQQKTKKEDKSQQTIVYNNKVSSNKVSSNLLSKNKELNEIIMKQNSEINRLRTEIMMLRQKIIIQGETITRFNKKVNKTRTTSKNNQTRLQQQQHTIRKETIDTLSNNEIQGKNNLRGIKNNSYCTVELSKLLSGVKRRCVVGSLDFNSMNCMIYVNG